jgi:hypothetical protein
MIIRSVLMPWHAFTLTVTFLLVILKYLIPQTEQRHCIWSKTFMLRATWKWNTGCLVGGMVNITGLNTTNNLFHVSLISAQSILCLHIFFIVSQIIMFKFFMPHNLITNHLNHSFIYFFLISSWRLRMMSLKLTG